jgi:hypothetical protein
MGTVVGQWRLKAIIVLFLTMIVIYTCYGYFSNIDVSSYDVGSVDDYTIDENDTTKGLESSQSFWDVVLGLGDFLSFGLITNIWARFVVNLFVSVCWIVIGYIGYTFVKEWIPLT